MSVCRPTSSVAPGGWVTTTSDSWCYYKPEHPKAPGRKLIIPERAAITLLEEGRPTKRRVL